MEFPDRRREGAVLLIQTVELSPRGLPQIQNQILRWGIRGSKRNQNANSAKNVARC